MSTRSVLTIVGQYIGGMYGGSFGSLIGGMIGGAIGGAIDPEKIQGPKLGEAQIQTSRDGVPRPIVYGIGPIVGNLIDRGELEIVSVGERQGKAGTTPIVEHDEAYMTYAIRICEGPIIGIRRIWENERLVFDAVPGPNLQEQADDPAGVWEFMNAHLEAQAGNDNWISNKRIYLGDEDQLPDSALEAIHGVGNVPAYRGSAYIVFEHENLTKTAGAIPTYRFEVVGRGNAGTRSEVVYDLRKLPGFRKTHWPLSDDESQYTLTGTRYSATFTPLAGLTGDSIDEIIDQATMYGDKPTQYVGYAARENTVYGIDVTTETYDPSDVDAVYLVYNNPTDISQFIDYEAYGSSAACVISAPGIWICDKRGAVFSRFPTASIAPYEELKDCGGGVSTAGMFPLVIKAQRKKQCAPHGGYARPRYGRVPVLMPDSPDFTFDYASGLIEPIPTATAIVGGSNYHVLQNESTSLATWGFYYTAYDVGPAIPSGDPRYNSQAYWEFQYGLARARGALPPGLVYGVDYPVLKTADVCRKTLGFYEVAPDGLYLYEIVDDICDRCDIGTDERDTSELTDIVLGYVVPRQMNGAEVIRGTQGAYLFDMPEYDARIRGVKRGAASVVTITDDDLVWSGDEPTELLVRSQAVEYPRKLHVISYDPITSYVPTKETAERRSVNVESVSEVTINLALTLEHDERAQISDRSLKIAWAEAQGSVQISVPDYLSKYVASNIFTYGGRRFRIDRVQTFDGFQTWECVADRQSAYTSTLTGTAPLDPTTPPLSRLAGPTLLCVLNIPAQAEADEQSGVYVSVAGVTTGWQGCMLQMSTDGGVTWANIQAIRTATAQGYLTTSLADESGSPSDNDFGVRVYGGDLESATASQVATGTNRAAVSADEGQTWEIVSFETATETADRNYTLSELARGLDETEVGEYVPGNFFTMLTGLTFVPISDDFDGQEIRFRAVTLGTSEDNAYTETIIFHVQDVIWDGGAP